MDQGPVTASDLKEMKQVASRLIADMKCDIVKSFNSTLAQMLGGMARIMSDRRTQFDMWKDAVDTMRTSDVYVLSMIQFLQSKKEHIDWVTSHNIALFASASGSADATSEVTQILGEISQRFAGYSDKTKNNIWSFVELLATFAVKYCELLNTPLEVMEAGLAQTMQAMPAWQTEFQRKHGRQPTLEEVQTFSAQLLSGQPVEQ
jgi:7-cyano-7-deazaguanine synthase in queuosine biosynthesis